jgi:hypothetical protein
MLANIMKARIEMTSTIAFILDTFGKLAISKSSHFE